MSDSGERKYGHAEFAGGSFGYRHTEDGIHLYSFEGSAFAESGRVCCNGLDRLIV